MLAKTVDRGGQDWDARLPFVLFAYRASPQGSTKESPFFLLHGRGPQLSTEAMMDAPVNRKLTPFDDYKTQLSVRMTDVWNLARANVKRAQEHQKAVHDHRSRPGHFRVGQRVFVYMPGDKQGKA